MSLLSIFKILLYRYSKQTDILVGTPIANRNHAEIESLIGFFVNTLVLRTDLSGHISFKELLEQIKKTTLEAYSNQDIPFEQIVEKLQPERSLSYSPLFQVMFVLQNQPAQPLALTGLSITPIESEQTTAKFDLTLVLQEIDHELKGYLEYNTDLFEPETVQQMIRHFKKY